MAIAIAGIGLLFTVLFHVGVHERDPNQLAIALQQKELGARPKEIAKPELIKPTLKHQWLAWFKNWHFYRVLLTKLISGFLLHL